jgi:hypothetical protein
MNFSDTSSLMFVRADDLMVGDNMQLLCLLEVFLLSCLPCVADLHSLPFLLPVSFLLVQLPIDLLHFVTCYDMVPPWYPIPETHRLTSFPTYLG